MAPKKPKQLPSSGNSSANRPKAVAQRTATAVKQRVNQDITTLRALADNMRRNKARADRQIPADKSPSVRRVGPGGANPKPQGQLPPGQRGGDMRQKGGPLAQRQSSAMTERSREVSRGNNGGPVRPVQVRDMGSPNRTQLSAGQQRALPQSQPSARRQAAQAKADAAARGSQGPSRVGQPAGSANRMYGANVVNAAVDRAMRQPRPSARGNAATAVIGTLGEMAVRPLARAAGQKLGEALRPVGRAIDNAMPGINSKDERSRKTNTPYETQFPQARANAQVRVNRIKAATPDAPAPSQTRQRPAATEMEAPRSASGSPTRSRSASSQAVSSASAAPGQKWSDFNPNRGTSKSNNPLLDRNDGYLRKKMQEREGKAAANTPSTAIGPVADGTTYSGNLKPATGMGPVRNAAEYSNMLKINKAKEDKRKKKA